MKLANVIRQDRIPLWVLLGSMAVAPASFAVDFTAAVGTEAAYSTNSNQVSVDEIQQWTYTPSLQVGATHESSALEWESAYNYERRIYQQSRFDDENALTGNTQLQWNAVPERLTINLEHFQTESTINSIQNNVPDNRQESSQAEASLSYQQPTVGRQFLTLSGSYSDQSFEETGNDSETTSVELAYSVPTSEVRGYEVFISENSTEFDDFSFANYDSQNGGLRFYSNSRDGSIELEIGYTETDPDGPGDSVSGYSGLVNIQRGVSSALQWGVVASRRISDRSNQLNRGTVDNFDQLNLVDSGLTNVFTETLINVNVAAQVGANQWRASVGSTDNDFDDPGQDTETTTFAIGLDRIINPRVRAVFELSLAEQQFGATGQSDDLFRGRVSFDWDRSARLNFVAAVTYQERDSENAQAAFQEWIGSLSVTYALLN